MLKNVYKLSDGHNIVSVICNQKTIEKIVRIMMGYVNLIEEDNINTVIMNISVFVLFVETILAMCRSIWSGRFSRNLSLMLSPECARQYS